MPPKSKKNTPKTTESVSQASSGAEEAQPEQSETSTAADTPATPPVEAVKEQTPPGATTTPLEDKMAQEAAQEPSTPHPYKWRIEAPTLIPFGMREPSTGEPCKKRIEAHIQDCWRAKTTPDVAGVLVSLPKE